MYINNAEIILSIKKIFTNFTYYCIIDQRITLVHV